MTGIQIPELCVELLTQALWVGAGLDTTISKLPPGYAQWSKFCQEPRAAHGPGYQTMRLKIPKDQA